MNVPNLFTADVHTFWATTFTFDIKLFDQYLLRRLGSPPLNAVVLCDEDCLTTALLGLTETDRRVAASANRRYLLRGMRAGGGGRFHPKTYLFASRRRTTLLVGSGNLTRSGIDRGRETFVVLDAADPDGARAIRAWAAWVGELVARRDDAQLTARYRRLRDVLAPSVDGDGRTTFVTNETEPLVEPIVARAPRSLAEVHVTAPFFDEHARALHALIDRLRPHRRVVLYLTEQTSVDGRALRAVLDDAACEVEVRRYDGVDFVHSKLIGLIGSDGDGLLACGSANLSLAALMHPHDGTRRANIEAMILRRGTADAVRDIMVPPDCSTSPLALDDLDALIYGGDEELPQPRAVRLLHATPDADRHVTVRAVPAPAGLFLASDGTAPVALDGSGRTVSPFGEDVQPITVWLADDDGIAQSNAIVLDDPDGLEQALSDRQARERNVPPELDDSDRSELTQLLTWAHRQFIFDLDDTDAVKRAGNAGHEEAAARDADFLERYVREELRYDPRSPTYRPRVEFGTSPSAELLLAEIRAMLAAAPGARTLRYVGTSATGREPPGEGRTGASWSLSARERVRAVHLLRRWARALADPRHAWISPDGPLRNYEALIETLTLIWLADALADDDRMAQLLGETWGALLGTDQRPGFFDRADPALLGDAFAGMSDDVTELAAGLACVSLRRPRPWPDYIYDWQPFLVRGIEHGVFSPGPLSSEVIEAIADERLDEQEIADVLMQRAEWLDDDAWGTRLATVLGVPRITLLPHTTFKGVDVAVRLDGLARPAEDPRVVALAQQTMRFRGTDNVLVWAGDARLLLKVGEAATALVNGRVLTSPGPIDRRRLEAVLRQNGSVADLLGVTDG